MVENQVTVHFDDNRRLVAVFGPYDENLAYLERQLGVSMSRFGNEVVIAGGGREARELGSRLLEDFYQIVGRGGEITPRQIDRALHAEVTDAEGVRSGAEDPPNGVYGDAEPARVLRTPRKNVAARSKNQARLIDAFERADITFASGPAGAGKTYLAVAYVVSALTSGRVDKIILSRPALEAGERIGFLPGDLRDKVDPYLRPLFDAIHAMMPLERCARYLASGVIEIVPLAFMRGRTLRDAVIILDEAQNCSLAQLKMFLTRLGSQARMIICGDPTQHDLPRGVRSGLAPAIERLEVIARIEHIALTSSDIVRHALIGKILFALEGIK